MRSLTFILNGDPTPLARARMGKWSVYDSQKHEKLVHGIQLQNQMDDDKPLSGPLILDATFYMPTGRNKRRLGTPHYFRPDLDNLLKYINDISQAIIFHDDCTIYKIQAIKIYDDNPRTVFTFTEALHVDIE
jgi:Holliday junction resolvase RusA-like endonuclease